jgi:hypothetical protein
MSEVTNVKGNRNTTTEADAKIRIAQNKSATSTVNMAWRVPFLNLSIPAENLPLLIRACQRESIAGIAAERPNVSCTRVRMPREVRHGR